MTRLLAVVPFILFAAILPPEGGSHSSATQAIERLVDYDGWFVAEVERGLARAVRRR